MDALGVSPKRFEIGDIVTVQPYLGINSSFPTNKILLSITTKGIEYKPMVGATGSLDQQWEVRHGKEEHCYSL